MSDVRYLVSVGKLYCSSEQLNAVVKAIQGLDRVDMQYKGTNKGQFGDDYDWVLRNHKSDEAITIQVVPEAVTLYFNTFGKEETK